MTRERTADRPGGLKRICAALASLAMFVLPLLPPFAPLLISGYQNYVAAPKIQYYPDEQKGENRFTVPSDFRSVRLGVEAHLIIQCGKHVISVINLTNYYKDNVVLFHQGSGVAERENQAQIPYLRERIDQELQKKLTEDHGENVLEQVGPLYVYVSLLSGVKYQNLLGNTINRQCIIGQDSLVQDYSVRKAIIKKRLNRISLEVPETPDAIEEDEKLIYEVSPLAEQQLTDTLFEPQPADVGPSSPSAIEWLHILDPYVGVAPSQAMLTAYKDELEHQQPTGPLIINAEDVALMNGKLFWVLGDCLENGNVPDEYGQYLNSFYAAGFQCMALGREQIREDDPDCAIFCYYMGNFSERLLGRLSEEEEFYQTLGKNSIGYYGKAQDLLKTGGYDAEDDMALHIEDGIRTLEGLGFEYVRPEDTET